MSARGTCIFGTKLPQNGPCPKCGATPWDVCLAHYTHLRNSHAPMLAALKRIEPNIGWRGKSDDDLESDLFHCEFCGASAAIATDVPHHDECPVHEIRAAITAAEQEDAG